MEEVKHETISDIFGRFVDEFILTEDDLTENFQKLFFPRFDIDIETDQTEESIAKAMGISKEVYEEGLKQAHSPETKRFGQIQKYDCRTSNNILLQLFSNLNTRYYL